MITSENQSPRKILLRFIVHLISSFGIVFCLTCLFLGMRGVMDLGGFVAVGGPYQIAHPAPDWVWLVPVSIIMGLIFVFINAGIAGSTGGVRLAVLAWPALFLSLGWNFLEYGIFKYHRLIWGWLICGILFVLMGGAPLLLGPIIKGIITRPKGTLPVLLLIIQLAVIGLSIYSAVAFFTALSR
jgi:hypothetical protein